MHQIIEDVRKEYPIEYKDYLQDPAYRADSLYYNCSHLNNIGATRFGAQIKADFHLIKVRLFILCKGCARGARGVLWKNNMKGM